MSEGTSTQDGNNPSGDTSAAGDEFKPITSQEEFEARLKDRLARERAKFADYKDLKAKAARLDEIEEANKTETQRLADRLTEAERAAETARSEALRFKVASKFGVSDEDVDLFLTGTDEETLTKQAQRLSERTQDRKRNGNVVPREGATTTPQPDEMRAFTRNLFGGE